jgi:hypothetical protein
MHPTYSIGRSAFGAWQQNQHLLKVAPHIYPILCFSPYNLASERAHISSIHTNFCSVTPPSIGPQNAFDLVQWVTWFRFGHSNSRANQMRMSQSGDADYQSSAFCGPIRIIGEQAPQ